MKVLLPICEPSQAFVHDVRVAAGRGEGRDQVIVREHLVVDGAGLDRAGPANDHRHAVAAFPVGCLLAAERRLPPSGQVHDLGAIVGGEDDDGVVGDAEVVELLEQLTDIAVELHHAIRIEPVAGLALRRRLQMRPHVHARGIEVAEPRRVGLLVAIDEIERGAEEFLVHRFHALGIERAGVLDHLPADAAVGGVDGRIVAVARLALENAARTELRAEARVFRIVRVLRLFLGVEMVEVAEELVEAVHRRQEFVAVAEMVLAELAGGVAERLERFRDAHVFGVQADRRRPAGRPWSGQCGSATVR